MTNVQFKITIPNTTDKYEILNKLVEKIESMAAEELYQWLKMYAEISVKFKEAK